MRLPHSVFCCACCVAICILYDDGFLSLRLAFQWDIHRTTRWNHGLSYDKRQAQTSTYSSRNHGFFSVVKFLCLKEKAFSHKVFPFKKQTTSCMVMVWALVFPSRRGKNEEILLVFFPLLCVSVCHWLPVNTSSQANKQLVQTGEGNILQSLFTWKKFN